MMTSVSAVMAMRGKRLRIKAVRSALALMVAAAGGPPGTSRSPPPPTTRRPIRRFILPAFGARPLKSIIREEIDR